MTNRLLPCPFCGEDAYRVHHNENSDWWQYACSADGKTTTCTINPVGHIYDHQHEAIKAWNTRAVSDVTELVRYDLDTDTNYDYDGTDLGTYSRMVKTSKGEYVRHDQSAELLEASSKRLENMRRALDAMIDEKIEAEISAEHWKANHDQMVQRNAVLRQRPDLPADRLPAIARYEAEIKKLQEENHNLKHDLSVFHAGIKAQT